jgi:hypothetical protein
MSQRPFIHRSQRENGWQMTLPADLDVVDRPCT